MYKTLPTKFISTILLMSKISVVTHWDISNVLTASATEECDMQTD